ncbi:MAG: hypothetical protein ACLFRM_09055 [Guyparkeria sp.]|uniref:hypothetical protein n=1 Tax=Guyparkeria sp. TaxID=2035736 RepID=UPI00397B3504
MKRMTLPALMLLAAFALAGCYEDTTPTQYEPGVYKGADDPLLDKLESDDDLRNQLDERFEQAATDR